MAKKTLESKTEFDRVKEFTVEARGEVPASPITPSLDDVRFIALMVLEELREILEAYTGNSRVELMQLIVQSANPKVKQVIHDDTQLITEVADGLVDIKYYIDDFAIKKGINLPSVFDEVHGANLSKKDPTTGNFIIREDGKIMKPANWVAPDIRKVIETQMK